MTFFSISHQLFATPSLDQDENTRISRKMDPLSGIKWGKRYWTVSEVALKRIVSEMGLTGIRLPLKDVSNLYVSTSIKSIDEKRNDEHTKYILGENAIEVLGEYHVKDYLLRKLIYCIARGDEEMEIGDTYFTTDESVKILSKGFADKGYRNAKEIDEEQCFEYLQYYYGNDFNKEVTHTLAQLLIFEGYDDLKDRVNNFINWKRKSQ